MPPRDPEKRCGWVRRWKFRGYKTCHRNFVIPRDSIPFAYGIDVMSVKRHQLPLTNRGWDGKCTIEMAPDDIPFGSNGMEQPTFYADYIRGTMVGAGVVKLNFVENRLDAISGEIRSIHVATIISPLIQLRAWANYLNEIATRHEAAELTEMPGKAAAEDSDQNG